MSEDLDNSSFNLLLR